MLRTCDGNDPNLVNSQGDPCACGLIFDDVLMEVVYPHRVLLSRAEKDDLIQDLWDKVQSAPGAPYVWGSGPPTERSTTE
jgi:hypothetical protein